MRILHVVPTYFPATRYGGPIASVHGLCRALAERGHDVHVFTTNVDGAGNSAVPLGVPVVQNGVRVWYFPVPILRRLYWSPRMRSALDREVPRFDVVHTHSVFLWPTWAAARSARKHGVPYIVAPRGMIVKDMIRRKGTLRKKLWISLVERGNMENAAGIHVTSAVEAEQVAAFAFALPRLYEIPNGYSPEEPCARPAEPREELRRLLQAGKPLVLYLGRISWKKGLDRLIEALPRVPNAMLVLAGNDEERHLARLTALAREHGVKERVVFVGPAHGADKAALYAGAAVCVLPSYSENFGNVVLEAMACGCPVIVTPQVGAAAVVERSGAGLVVPAEPRVLGDAIRGLLESAVERLDMGERGRSWVLRNCSWSSIAERMLDVYRQAIDARESAVGDAAMQ